MLVRINGGNKGVCEYLEKGYKQGREYTRDEIDHRLVLDGDLALTESVIDTIPDNGQERYIHITLSFFEDNISESKLHDVVQEYKSLMMNAYHEDEYNFYAEAHLPKIKQMPDYKTGEMVERKPHIHIVIPEVNLVTGSKLNPRGMTEHYIQYFDAIQEHINNKYNLVSPKDGVRVSDHNHANVLSRAKGDFYRERHSEFKCTVFDALDTENIRTEKQFADYLSRFGEVKEYNKGESNRYFGVKLEGDSKFTRLKSPLFSRQYISDRSIPLLKPTKTQIESRLKEWKSSVSYEIKHIHPAGQKIRKEYAALAGEDKQMYLKKVINRYDEKHNLQRQDRRQNSDQSGIKYNTGKFVSGKTIGLPRLPARELVYGLHGRSGGKSINKSQLLLQQNEYGDLSTTGRQKVDPDRYVRRLQDRAGRRVVQSPLESNIKAAIQRSDDLPFLKQIRTEINAERYLSNLQTRFNIDPSKHTVSYAQDGSPRFRVGNRNMNASDFLTKHLNLEWDEAKEVLLDIWQDQKDNKPFDAVITRVSLTRQQAKERFICLNEHKGWVNNEIKYKHNDNIANYRAELRGLLAIRNKQEREVARGYIIFKKLEREREINSIRKACFREINSYYHRWNPDRRYDMALGDSLKKIIRNPVDGNSISSGNEKEVFSVVKRVQQSQQVQDYVKRELTDLVPHKVSPKETRYLDPKTTQTVFTDKGNHVRVNGEITQDKAEAALLYAKEKFGGMLKLNGSEEFKVACAMAAAEKGMNVILRPEKYHEMMQVRLQELKAEHGHENSVEAERQQQVAGQKPEQEQEKRAEQVNSVEKDTQAKERTPEVAESVRNDDKSRDAVPEQPVKSEIVSQKSTSETSVVQEAKKQESVQKNVSAHSEEREQQLQEAQQQKAVTEKDVTTGQEKQTGDEQSKSALTTENPQQQNNASLQQLQEEAKVIASQHQEAQRLLNEAVENGAPKEEVDLLSKGVNSISARAQTINEQIKAFEEQQGQKKAKSVEEKNENTTEKKKRTVNSEKAMEREIERVSKQLAKEMNIDKQTVKDTLKFIRFEDVNDLKAAMKNPETVEAVKREIVSYDNALKNERERERNRDNTRSR
ncbi:TPA: LPD7 domain-containing protein [Escherichia coli]